MSGKKYFSTTVILMILILLVPQVVFVDVMLAIVQKLIMLQPMGLNMKIIEYVHTVCTN